MKSLELFDKISELENQIDRKIEKLFLINTRLTSTTTTSKDVDVQSSTDLMQFSKLICEKMETEAEIDRLIDRKYDLKRYIQGYMLRLSSEKQYNILCSKYFDKKSLYQISQESGADYSNVKHLHRNALKELEKLLNGVE